MTDGQDGPRRRSPAPRPLSPARPWEDRADGAGTHGPPKSGRGPRHAAPVPDSKPWARGPGQIESPPLDEPNGWDGSAPGLAPIRPWRSDRPAASLAPRPSNPDVVLHDLAAELGSGRPVETDDERRRRFARQHAAADAAQLTAARTPAAQDEFDQPPSSDEPGARRRAVVARVRRGWRRRRDAGDEEEGPFFPPEAAAPVPVPSSSEVPSVPVSRNRPSPRPPEQPSPARQRPRPRPAPDRAEASPAAETSTEISTEPDPAGHRSPDISRFLAATEPQPGDDDQEPKEPMRRRRRIRGSRGLRLVTRFVIVAAVTIAAAVVLRIYVVAPYYIPSGSMEQTLHGGNGTNDHILVDKITYRIHDPHQGDIVVFDRPDTWRVQDKTLVKRVIGLPGDRLQLRNGLVYVNGMRLTENYLDKDCPAPVTRPLNGTTRWTVPMDDYFVMGDNRCDSDDSRMYGPIPRSKIVGRAFLIIWPLSRFGTP